MLCTIWYHLCNLKNLKNTHRGALLFVVTLIHGCCSRFFKPYKWYQIAQRITYFVNYCSFLSCVQASVKQLRQRLLRKQLTAKSLKQVKQTSAFTTFGNIFSSTFLNKIKKPTWVHLHCIKKINGPWQVFKIPQ